MVGTFKDVPGIGRDIRVVRTGSSGTAKRRPSPPRHPATPAVHGGAGEQAMATYLDIAARQDAGVARGGTLNESDALNQFFA
ncbi:hypothetical protein QRO11_06765 [Paracidovorax citrulli]|uniref:hypothetical protein n=1 Tax=Paracidovorax citrulli TaxID=80869 RepID=UPI000890EF4C|nr:hypothetical protein [Paracidovorax citrulli]WIY37031.1 hypothetical protein QRO11_06765 [Paracidovorax citrulli]SDJ88216.1 hypothetical protein SAMN04489709_108144 [Paracidovorax citrulli]